MLVLIYKNNLDHLLIFIWLYNYANIGIFVCLFGETIHGHGVLPSSHGIVCYHRIA